MIKVLIGGKCCMIMSAINVKQPLIGVGVSQFDQMI